MTTTNKDMFSCAKQFGVGFDDIFDRFRKASSFTSAYPPYNIQMIDKANYKIVLAVAGFKKEEIKITLQKNELTVEGDKDKGEVKPDLLTYLYRGIGARNFYKTFLLANDVNVTGSDLEDGLLTIYLTRILPEEEQPKLIPIGTATKAQLLNEEDKNVEIRNENNSTSLV